MSSHQIRTWSTGVRFAQHTQHAKKGGGVSAGPAFAALAKHRPNKWLESCVCRATSILFIIVTLNIMLVKYCYYIIQI